MRKTILRARLKKMYRMLEKERQQRMATATVDISRQDTTQPRQQLTREEEELDREIAKDFYGS